MSINVGARDRLRAQLRDAPGRWVERFGRGGLVAYGAIHLIVAALGLRIATIGGRVHFDQRGAVATVASGGVFGRGLLVAAIIALTAFAVWQLRAAAVGYRWVPEPGLRWRKRGGAIAKAAGVGSVAWSATRFVARDPGDRRGVRVMATQLFAVPGGRMLVALIAVIILVMSVAMAFTGARRTFMGDLSLDRLPPRLHRTTMWLGAIGNLTRAVTFAALGLLTAVAVVADDPDRIGGLDLALRTLADHTAGVAVIVVAAAGFAAYGAYCILDAWARHP